MVHRVLKYLLSMPQSPTDWPSVMYHWKYKRNKSAGKVLAGIFFWRASSVCKTVSVCLFFFTEKSSDGNENYRRSIFRQTDFIGNAVGKNITDKLCVLHRQN